MSVVPLVRVHTDPAGGGGRAGRVLIKNVAIVIYDPSQATTKMIESCVYGIYMMKVKKGDGTYVTHIGFFKSVLSVP